jgi:hypothetical protein
MKVNVHVITNNELTNNFTSLVTSTLGPDAARGPPFVPRLSKLFSLYVLPPSESNNKEEAKLQALLV